MASAAAASGGWKRGSAAGQLIGRNRTALALAVKDPEEVFVKHFRNCQGNCTMERLAKAFEKFTDTGIGRKMKLKLPEHTEMDFLLKMSDRAGGTADNRISVEEARFAFRVWVGFDKMHSQVQELFERFDVDQSGCLDIMELHAYLVELNEGFQVSKAEVNYVMKFVDINKDGALDKHELVFATCVWYCDINYADLALNVPRASSVVPSKRGRNPKLKVIIIGCFNLRNADGWGAGLSDPFCVCGIPGRAETNLKTHTVHDELSPTWNYQGFISELQTGDDLDFTVYDEDFMKPPNLLGTASFSFDEYYPDGFIGTKTLSKAGSAQGKASIQLRIIVLEPLDRSSSSSENDDAPRQEHTSRMTIFQNDEGSMRHSTISDEDEASKVMNAPATAEALAYPDAPDICHPPDSGPDVEPLMLWSFASLSDGKSIIGTKNKLPQRGGTFYYEGFGVIRRRA